MVVAAAASPATDGAVAARAVLVAVTLVAEAGRPETAAAKVARPSATEVGTVEASAEEAGSEWEVAVARAVARAAAT